MMGEIEMTKPRRGDCGSCHWFELQPGEVNGHRIGNCMVAPPTPLPSMQQHPVMQNQARMVTHAIRPPVAETDRCEKWRVFGAMPRISVTELMETLSGEPDAAE